MAAAARKLPVHGAMNNLDDSRAKGDHPILRVRETEDGVRSQQAECVCPELCQIDHGN